MRPIVLGYLQQKGKLDGLTEAERIELLTLLQIYQVGQLHKSQGLAEAVQRGLRRMNFQNSSTNDR